MYSIIGGDGKTYGPVTADEVHRWIREGRADERTKVKEEGCTEWRELGTISAFFPALANVPPKISGRAGLNTVATEGSVHIGDCLRQGWQVYRQDPWRITGIIVIVFVAQFLLNSIPIAGALFAFLLNGPILGGVYFFCMQAIHGQTHGLQDVTSTIKERFLPCFLATTVSSLLAFAPLLVALIPAVGLFAASGVVMEELVKHPNLILGIGLPLLAGAIAMFYLLICWSFAVPIAACTNTDFWEALKLSWRGVRKNFWAYFGLLLALGLINLIGILCLVVGLFVTIPFTFLATMVAYEQIFRTTHSR
jgi:uncharacterized membrane protein